MAEHAGPSRDWATFALAIGLAIGFNMLVFAVIYDAILNNAEAGISDNGAQVLMTLGTGIVGLLGSALGYRTGVNATTNTTADPVDTAERRGDSGGS